jgi:predicted metal-dependent hydrolase
MNLCSGSRASSLPRKKRSTPQSRIVATPRTLELVSDAYKIGLDHIRAGRFFEAHEELEVAWRAAAPEERDFYQGLVHVAVAWYQAGRGKPVATERQLEKALRRLEPYEPEHRGIDVASLRAQLAELRAAGSLDLPPPRV